MQESGKEISRDVQAKIQEHDFYQIVLPVTLKSKVGWAFSRLECKLHFCDGETDSSQLPVVYSMFPKDNWVDVLQAGIDCTVTLDEQMQFAATHEEAGGEFQAKIKSFLSASFRYRLRRPKIKARGKLDVCSWQLDGKEYVDEENVLLGVLLMVPKTRKHPISVTAEAIAYHDFQFLTADIFSGYFKEFDEKLKSFFRAGLPLRADIFSASAVAIIFGVFKKEPPQIADFMFACLITVFQYRHKRPHPQERGIGPGASQ